MIQDYRTPFGSVRVALLSFSPVLCILARCVVIAMACRLTMSKPFYWPSDLVCMVKARLLGNFITTALLFGCQL